MNGYGPTETDISCTMKVITSNDNITIGKPNTNVLVYIIDENNNEAPDGQVGELLICGNGIGRDYKNLPGRTAEASIEYNGMRGCKSGDLALINLDGEIEFYGRKDNQKIDKKSPTKPVFKQGDSEVPKKRTQQRIFDIVASVAGNSNFGTNTPFYRVGLSSLGAMKLNVRLAEEFNIAIKTGDINRWNTVALMETFIENTEAPQAKEIRLSYPLTGSQKKVFAECRKNPESIVYNIQFLFTLDQSIDENKPAEAVSKTTAKYVKTSDLILVY